MPNSGIARSYGNFIPSLLRNLHNVSIMAVALQTFWFSFEVHIGDSRRTLAFTKIPPFS